MRVKDSGQQPDVAGEGEAEVAPPGRVSSDLRKNNTAGDNPGTSLVSGERAAEVAPPGRASSDRRKNGTDGEDPLISIGSVGMLEIEPSLPPRNAVVLLMQGMASDVISCFFKTLAVAVAAVKAFWTWIRSQRVQRRLQTHFRCKRHHKIWKLLIIPGTSEAQSSNQSFGRHDPSADAYGAEVIHLNTFGSYQIDTSITIERPRSPDLQAGRQALIAMQMAEAREARLHAYADRYLSLGTVPMEQLPRRDAKSSEMCDLAGTLFSIDSDRVQICDVWADGVTDAFSEIAKIIGSDVDGEFWVAFDTEFAIPDDVYVSKTEPPTADGHYRQLCTYLNGGNLVQVGIGLADRKYNLAKGIVFQFNLRFDPEWRKPDHSGVAFMRKSGLQLEQHKIKGIPSEDFMILLEGSGLLGKKNLKWVTFNGYPDFGFLIMLLRGNQPWPATRTEFLNRFWCNFPASFDCKYIAKYGKCVPENKRKLIQVASAMGVKLDEDKAHQAGADALCALKVFKKFEDLKPEFVKESSGVLYGICAVQSWMFC